MVKALKGYALLAAASLLAVTCWQERDMPWPLSMRGLVANGYMMLIGTRDGRPCASYPVCSDYARQAIMRYGLLLGSWIALDRLIHEGGDLAQGPYVLVRGRKRLYDPLVRNTFWLEDEHEH
ncbi:MAG: membrane protein insertion efficiency factor YidD [Zetaproteobacteria bacterium]|nr:MAG: membrane protein insertion efficiency factor YidD [Zetaproteobacteria bacterium]